MKGLIRWHRQLAWIWVVIVLGAVLYNGKVWLVDHRPLETDILALLPTEADDPVVRQAFDSVGQSTEQIALILVGSHDWTRARTAGAAFSDALARHPNLFSPVSLTAMGSDSALAPWWNSRRGLLTEHDRVALDSMSSEEWAQAALREVTSPLAIGRIGTWQDDPFGFFRRWLQARVADTPVRPMDGVLRVDDGQMHYVVVALKLGAAAQGLQGQRSAVAAVADARAGALRTGPDIRVEKAGFVFPAAASAAQANHELSIIGGGSLIGIILLIWITFGSLRPIGLIVVSLAVGLVFAVAVTAWWYPRMHLLSLVFGASLIGIAEDYGMHYLCVSDRQKRGGVPVISDLFPSLGLAMLTTGVSFIALAVSPFPGLQQIALFSTAGLLGSWMTVVLWFPALDGPQVARTQIVVWSERVRARWVSLVSGRPKFVLLAVLAVACAVGLARLRANDDIRLLENLPAGMLREQANVGRILQAPFEAQFFVVRAQNEEKLLEREEALRIRLDQLVPQKVITGYQAVSTWVPSRATQRADSALVTDRLYAPNDALDQLQHTLGENNAWANSVRGATSTGAEPLTIHTWLASPVSEPLRQLWLGRINGDVASVVLLKNVNDQKMAQLGKAGEGIPGVTWADKVASISGLLGQYRLRMSWILIANYFVIWLLLMPRYGRSAIRVVAPTACASLIALAALGWLGEPLQLFHILALYLVFGLGIDYSIFLTERTHSPKGDVTLAVGLAAVSTVLSLGLLALSSTPFLHAFGLTMLIGIIASLLAASLICRGRDSTSPDRPVRPTPVDTKQDICEHVD